MPPASPTSPGQVEELSAENVKRVHQAAEARPVRRGWSPYEVAHRYKTVLASDGRPGARPSQRKRPHASRWSDRPPGYSSRCPLQGQGVVLGRRSSARPTRSSPSDQVPARSRRGGGIRKTTGQFRGASGAVHARPRSLVLLPRPGVARHHHAGRDHRSPGSATRPLAVRRRRDGTRGGRPRRRELRANVRVVLLLLSGLGRWRRDRSIPRPSRSRSC